MIENMDDDPFMTKPIFVDNSGDVTPPYLSFIVVKEQRSRETLCVDKESCDCVIRTPYGLPCARIIDMKIHHNKPISLDEIHRHWKMLCMGEGINEDGFLSWMSGMVFKNV